ncbi:amino acid ABC transporter substrate-binding protein [bacterium]|nr:MAG: amino acid ABC transporter substrate-binding protein [bacterium]
MESHEDSTNPISRRRFTALAAAGLGLTVTAGAGPIAALAAGPEIPVGTLMPLTGAGGLFGQNMLKAVRAAVGQINAAGGPLGRKIRLYEEDDQTDPDAAVRAAKKLIEVNKVVAVIGTWASGVTLAVAPVCQASRVVEMSTSGASKITTVQKQGYVYRTEPDDTLFGRAYAEFALERGWKRMAVLGLNVPFTATTVGSFRRAFEARGGTVLSFDTYNQSQTTFRSETLKASQGNPDCILISGYEPDVTGILRSAYENGLHEKFLVPGFSVSETLIKNAGPAAEGLLLVQEGVSEGSPSYRRVASALGGSEYYSFAAQAWDQIQLVALAIEAAKSARGDAINRMLRAVSGPPGARVSSFAEAAPLLRRGRKVNYEGASGSIDFDADGNITTANFRVAEVRDGKIAPVQLVKGVHF